MARGRQACASGVIALVMEAAALALHSMGRVWTCTCGHAAVGGRGQDAGQPRSNSPTRYSFSHIIHGMISHAVLHFCAAETGGCAGDC